ncbi:hypothetical protein C2845_PM08G14360 [Panicum miliaceum]|uniref:Uncharacterized protein n=1 Tax=Panicum miliaceum TaxID=4540 RepID=A0A3L6R2W5_PANMI|nr:hypothetical protein C2845_PM08G14360 [Panicum miliaceum]
MVRRATEARETAASKLVAPAQEEGRSHATRRVHGRGFLWRCCQQKVQKPMYRLEYH